MAIIQVNWRPDRRQLRWFGAAGTVAFGLLGAWVLGRHSLAGWAMAPATAHAVGGALLGLAAACGAMAAAAPAMLRPLYLLLTAVGVPIGFVMSHVVMAVVFYGLFAPVGLVFRLIGRDALHRKLDRQATSYWVPREPVRDVRRYFRQF